MSETIFLTAQEGHKVVPAANQAVPRCDSNAALLTSGLRGRLSELAKTKKLFCAANQAEVTTTVGLATTYTGICLYNSVGSGVILYPQFAGFALGTAPAGEAPIMLAGGYLAAGITTHGGTHLAKVSTYLNEASVSNALVECVDGCTIVGTPRYLMPLIGGAAHGAFPGDSGKMVDLGGFIAIPEGGYICITTLTVALGIGAFVWEERLAADA
jgi:hypothetical protein